MAITQTTTLPDHNDPDHTIPITSQSKCAYCEHIFDTNKLVWHSIISQYICLECRQSWLDRSEQRRQQRLQRQADRDRRHQELYRQHI